MLSTFALKIIAIISMLIDHVGAVFFPGVIWLRLIGRLAFPIFCFLIAEGYAHTKNAPKYLIRLGLFAIISEIPFNLAFHGELFFFNGCNVFVTLSLGLFAIMLYDAVRKWEGIPTFAASLLALIPVAALAFSADMVGSDYGKYGVVMIFIFHLFRDNRAVAMIIIALSTLLKYGIIAGAHSAGEFLFELGSVKWYFVTATQLFCFFAFIPISLYSGKKGYSGCKWLFYVFYPAHLILLWLVSVIMG